MPARGASERIGAKNVRKTRRPIGWVEERRTKERGDNLIGLLRLARRSYGTLSDDDLHIAVDGKEARCAWIRF
ncbi:MAG: hypothetical protein M1550_06540 [Deltaproteobacteria bacterium]|nr:hypothetical protein [Deltaproteobacteria bacterium]